MTRKCVDCNVPLIMEIGLRGRECGYCPSCRTDYSAKWLTILKDFEGFMLINESRATIDLDSDGTSWMRVVVIKAPYNSRVNKVERFIEQTKHALRWKAGCSHSFDCCGCRFEQGRDLVLLDKDYGFWALKIREGINI